MQLAKMFATLGFDIDTSKLSQFEAMIRGTRVNVKEFSTSVNTANMKLKSLTTHLGKAGTALDSTKFITAAKHLTQGMRQFTKSTGKFVATEPRFSAAADRIVKSVGRVDHAVLRGVSGWSLYAQSVTLARDRLQDMLRDLRNLNNIPNPPRPPRAPRGGWGGGNGGGGGGSSDGGGGSRGSNVGPLATVRNFFRPMLPTGMGFGGVLGAGYAVKELVQTGREMQAMEQKLKAVSRSSADFESNLRFVKKTSKDLAIDVHEFGKSYASIFQSAKASQSTEQIQKTALGMNKYFRALQMTPDEIKGSMKAIGQMYNKQKVMAEELTGQLGERAAGVVQLFAEASGKSVKDFFKDMQKGMVDPSIINKVADLMGNLAEKNGALSASLQMSAAKQVNFNNRMKEFSLVVLKLIDKPLGGLFDGLSNFLEILQPVTVALIEFFKLIGWGVKSIIQGVKEIWKFLDLFRDMNWAVSTLSLTFGAMVLSLISGSTIMAAAVTAAFTIVKKSLPFASMLAFIWMTKQIQGMYEGEENFASAISYAMQRMMAGMEMMVYTLKGYFIDIQIAGWQMYNSLKDMDFASLFDVEMPEWLKFFSPDKLNNGMGSIFNPPVQTLDFKPLKLDLTINGQNQGMYELPVGANNLIGARG